MKEVLLANPRGFCAGVDRAIDIVNRAIEIFGAPIYVRHEVVHNKFVVDQLRDAGAVFVDELHEVPDNTTVIFSAHGVSEAVQEEADRRNLQVFDATCPLVTKVHMEVKAHANAGEEVVLIGHQGHPEVEGTMGRYVGMAADKGGIYLVETPEDVAKLDVKDSKTLAYVSQTTLSMDDTAAVIDALREKFPAIQGPKKDDICYATQNRQDAVKALTKEVDLLLVVGSRNSSNSNRLRELGEKNGIPAYLIDNANEIDRAWVENATKVGVSAGASAPEVLVNEVVDRLREWGVESARKMDGPEEKVMFSLPKVMLRAMREKGIEAD